MEMSFSRAATAALCGTLSLASLSALSGCERKPPTPVTMSLLKSPAAVPLEGTSVQFSGQVQFLNSTTSSDWYQPPAIMVHCGDSFMMVPQAGYYIDTTYHLHRVTWTEGDQTRGWMLRSTSKFIDGRYHIAGTYHRLGDEGGFSLEQLEVMSAVR